jgi:hypothetical protein
VWEKLYCMERISLKKPVSVADYHAFRHSTLNSSTIVLCSYKWWTDVFVDPQTIWEERYYEKNRVICPKLGAQINFNKLFSILFVHSIILFLKTLFFFISHWHYPSGQLFHILNHFLDFEFIETLKFQSESIVSMIQWSKKFPFLTSIFSAFVRKA